MGARNNPFTYTLCPFGSVLGISSSDQGDLHIPATRSIKIQPNLFLLSGQSLLVASASPFSRKVIVKAAPALLLALFIFITPMLVAEYTEAIFLVVILWIALPVMVIWLYRKIRDRSKQD